MNKFNEAPIFSESEMDIFSDQFEHNLQSELKKIERAYRTDRNLILKKLSALNIGRGAVANDELSDMVQEAFTSAISYVKNNPDINIGSPFSYLFVASLNKLRDQMRKNRYRRTENTISFHDVDTSDSSADEMLIDDYREPSGSRRLLVSSILEDRQLAGPDKRILFDEIIESIFADSDNIFNFSNRAKIILRMKLLDEQSTDIAVYLASVDKEFEDNYPLLRGLDIADIDSLNSCVATVKTEKGQTNGGDLDKIEKNEFIAGGKLTVEHVIQLKKASTNVDQIYSRTIKKIKDHYAAPTSAGGVSGTH